MSALARSWRRSRLIVLGGTLLSGIVLGQGVPYPNDSIPATIIPSVPPRTQSTKAAIRLDVNLVLIPVMATDSYQRPIAGLHREDFRLFEDGVAQTISQFYSEEAPTSLGIVFDASNSMHHKIDESRQAIRDFLNLSLPGDELFLLKFSDRPEPVHSFTTDIHEIEEGLDSIQPAGWTSLFDAIYLGIHQMKRAKLGHKALLVLSDGGDNNSRYTEREMKEFVKEADVRIFAVSIFEKAPALEAIAEESGGKAYRVRNLEELRNLVTRLSTEIHTQYVLGYSPTNPARDGKYRHINIQLLPPQGIVHPSLSWKRGYYSPVE